ncbi:MAG: hypothetical protein R6V40_02675 [Candidatus Moraniibacteriota bacterium]
MEVETNIGLSEPVIVVNVIEKSLKIIFNRNPTSTLENQLTKADIAKIMGLASKEEAFILYGMEHPPREIKEVISNRLGREGLEFNFVLKIIC